MNYTTHIKYKNGLIEFYFTFNSDDGFLQYLSDKKELKNEFNSFSVAIALNKRAVRIIMPFGTNEIEFKEKANKIFQQHYNMFSMFYNNPYNNNDYIDMFANIFGGNF